MYVIACVFKNILNIYMCVLFIYIYAKISFPAPACNLSRTTTFVSFPTPLNNYWNPRSLPAATNKNTQQHVEPEPGRFLLEPTTSGSHWPLTTYFNEYLSFVLRWKQLQPASFWMCLRNCRKTPKPRAFWFNFKNF